jgi:hypothetical protein
VKPASPFPDPTPRSLSGVEIRTKTDVERLADAIHQHAMEGRIALWCVVELLYQLRPHHWAAYARTAGIPHPSPDTICLAVDLFKQQIGYIEPAAPQPNPPPQFS